MPQRLVRIAWCAGLGLVLASAPPMSHEIRPALLQLTETAPERFTVLWKQPVVQDRRLPIDPVLPDHCRPLAEPRPEVVGGALVQRWEVACALREGSVNIKGLARTLTDVLVEVRRLDGNETRVLLNSSAPSFDLQDPSPRVAAYLILGVEHLLLGIDHVLFVLGLVLFIPNRWALLKTITSFTLAHSITLALSVMGFVQVPQGPVEAVIALSILFLARELLLPQAQRSVLTQGRPWVMAFIFGLLHGLGFAGALAEIGLPREQLTLALFLFNVGIEAGQILIIALALMVFWALRRLSELAAARWSLIERATLWNAAGSSGATELRLAPINTALVYCMGAMATFWTIDRVLALL